MIRCSRAMSWAEARRSPSGGRRSAHRLPARVADRVGEVRPPAGDALEGERRLGARDVLREPASRRGPSIASSARSVASSAMEANPMRGHARHRAADRLRRRADDLGVGQLRRVLRATGLEATGESACSGRDPDALADLRASETGKLTEDEFECGSPSAWGSTSPPG